MSVVLVLVACSQHAFVKGKSLLEQGKVAEGFAQLQKAVEDEPRNLEYKSYYYRQRETWVSRLLRDAETARVNYRWEAAELNYQQVLEIDPENSRAREGIASIAIGRSNEIRLSEAESLLKSGDLQGAREKVRVILSEDKSNLPARNLLSRIERESAAKNNPAAIVNSKFKKTVTLEFRDANIKSVFELLSKSAGINFILDKEIRTDSRVSIFVTHTTIEDALQNILSTSQLSKKILNEKSVLIYPNSKKGEFEEKVVRTFYLNNVSVKQVQTLLQSVIKTRDMFVDDQMNILVMRDSPEAVRLAEKLISAYDISDPEVLLEVEVLEISTNKLNELGLRWPNQITMGVTGAAGNGQLTFDEAKDFNSSMGRLTITDPALILNLRGTDSSSNLLANPHIRVKNHKKAKIHIGDRVPVITSTSTSTGFVSESVSYLDVGLKLNVEPSILVNDEISIDIGLEVSNIVGEITSKNGTLTYRVGTRNADTVLRLKNGETQILAGLINDEERSTADRVPGISSLPLIGRLFSSKKDTRNKTEIVLLITPKIVRNIVPPESTFVEFSAGTESGNTPASMTAGGYLIAPPQPEEIIPVATDMGIADPTLPPQVPSNIPPPPPLPVISVPQPSGAP